MHSIVCVNMTHQKNVNAPKSVLEEVFYVLQLMEEVHNSNPRKLPDSRKPLFPSLRVENPSNSPVNA